LEQSALFWHQAIGYSVGKIDVFWKTFDKAREVKLKNGFSNILIILTILLLTLCQCCPAQESWALKDQLCQNQIWT